MSKQSEIREGVEILLCGLYNVHLDGNAYADKILTFLNEVGVVIKMDRELPQWKLEAMGSATENAIYKVAQKDMTSYVAVEPLIDKGKNDD